MISPRQLALLSLKRHPLTTGIAIVAIALAVACCGVLLRLHQVAESRFDVLGQGGDAIVGAKAGGIEILLGALNGEGGYPQDLPMKLFESLRAQQSVQHGDGAVTTPSYLKRIVPLVYFAKADSWPVIGTDEEFFTKSPSSSIAFDKGRWDGQGRSVVLGAQVAKKMGLKVGDKVELLPWLGEGKFLENSLEKDWVVTGILKETRSYWDRVILGPYQQAQRVFSEHPVLMQERSIWKDQVLHYFLVDLRLGGFAEFSELINRRTVAQLIDVKEEKAKLKSLSGLGQKVGLFITFFVISLGGLCIGSMLVTRFEGMSRQLAILRAIGYSQKELSAWLFWESLLLGSMGLLFGALLDALLFPVVRGLLGTALPPADLISVHLYQSWPVWLITLLAVMTAVILPIWRLVSRNTHDHLRT